jgi:hypothetical protein
MKQPKARLVSAKRSETLGLRRLETGMLKDAKAGSVNSGPKEGDRDSPSAGKWMNFGYPKAIHLDVKA